MRITLTIAAVVWAFALSGCMREDATELRGPGVEERRAGNEEGPAVRGRRTAEQDIRAGKPRYFSWGKPASEYWTFVDILEEKYNITASHGGCEPTADEAKFGKAYNARIREELAKRNVTIEMIWAEAEKQYEERAKKQEPLAEKE
jgi:hypothetical protein